MQTLAKASEKMASITRLPLPGSMGSSGGLARGPQSPTGSRALSPPMSPHGSGSYNRLHRLSQCGSVSIGSAGGSRSASPVQVSSLKVGPLLRDLQPEAPFKAQELAIANLCNLSVEEFGQKQVLAGGAVTTLLRVLTEEWAELVIREGAVATMYNLAAEAQGREAILQAGGLEVLAGMLQGQAYQLETRQLVTSILRLLCNSKACKKAMVRTAAIEALVAVIESDGDSEDTAEAKLNAIAVMQSISFTDEHMAVDWGRRGVLAALIRFMELKSPLRPGLSPLDPSTPQSVHKSPRSAALASAATVLQNLSVYEANKPYIVGAGGVRTMIAMTAEFRADIGVQMAAASVLFNLAVSAECCPAIVEQGGVRILLETLREAHPSIELRKFAAGTLHYMSATEEGAGAIREALVEIDATGSLFVQHLIGDEQLEEIGRHTAGLARNLTAAPDLLPAEFISHSFVPGILDQLRHSYTYDTKEDSLINALHCLAYQRPANKLIIAEGGGMELALKLLSFGTLKAGAVDRIAALFQTLTVAPENELRLTTALPLFLGMLSTEGLSKKAREFLLGAIQNVAVHLENKIALVNHGGIAAMTAIIEAREASALQSQCALGVLQNLSNVAMLKPKVGDVTVLRAVMARLTATDGRHPSEKEKEYGMGVILNVATLETARSHLVELGATTFMVRCMNSTVTSFTCKRYSAVALHRLCCWQDSLLLSIRREGGALALRRLVDHLPDPESQECVRWTLSRIEAAVA